MTKTNLNVDPFGMEVNLLTASKREIIEEYVFGNFPNRLLFITDDKNNVHLNKDRFIESLDIGVNPHIKEHTFITFSN